MPFSENVCIKGKAGMSLVTDSNPQLWQQLIFFITKNTCNKPFIKGNRKKELKEGA